MDFHINTVASADTTAEGPGIDFLEDLAQRIRANHRLRYKFASPLGAGATAACKGDAYVGITQVEVTRAVDGLVAAMAQQQVDSYYAAIEAQDYEDYLASQFDGDDADSPAGP